MSNALIPPVTPDSVPLESLSLLERQGERLEQTSHLLRTLAHSPAALDALVAQTAAAARMSLPPRARAAIALRVAALRGSAYGLAAHTAALEELGVDATAVRRYRDGLSGDATEQALLALVTKAVRGMGHHTGFALQAARRLGVRDAELVEAIALVGMNTFVTDLTSIAQTALDHTPLED